ncbi:MAG: hypothetical protein WC165_10945 [Dysgonamonadaceae bacterium]
MCRLGTSNATQKGPQSQRSVVGADRESPKVPLHVCMDDMAYGGGMVKGELEEGSR